MFATILQKKFKPLSPHILKIYIWKKFTISQALSGSLVICPSSGGYLPFDEYTRLFHWVITISKPKRKSSNCKKKSSPNRAVFYILLRCVWIQVEVEITNASWFNVPQVRNCKCRRSPTIFRQSPKCQDGWTHLSWFFQLLLFIPPSPKTPYFSIQ